LAELVTPNLAEAEALGSPRLESLAQMRTAAQALADRFGVPFLIKGGHLAGTARAVDVLFDGHRVVEFGSERIASVRTHGTGCTLSAAIAAHLALGDSLHESIQRAKRAVHAAIRHRLRVGKHHALNP
jgi:hydroxymethylpyrimidine/phosphomethylpyrimidine kinase